MAKIDLTGQRFGKLIVIKENPIRKNRQVMWDCLCDCGNTTTVAGNNLRAGRTKSCGCGVHCNRNNLVGQKFGRLTVLKDSGKRQNRGIIWTCRCDCGKIVDKSGQHLKDGSIVRCGQDCAIDSIVGKRYGKLTVLENTKKISSTPSDRSYLWKCRCDCGNICEISRDSLTSGKVKSCGCLKSSYGEYKIEQLLKENNIPYEKEKSFDTCRFLNTNRLAKFDFYIDNKYLIEFDGNQHFKYENNGWNNKENFDKTQQRDKYKNQWCKGNNIPLIRIPYTHLDNLHIDDLKLETSNFIYKEKN